MTLRERDRGRQGRNKQPTACIIDSQSVKTTTVGGTGGYVSANSTAWSSERRVPVGCVEPRVREDPVDIGHEVTRHSWHLLVVPPAPSLRVSRGSRLCLSGKRQLDRLVWC